MDYTTAYAVVANHEETGRWLREEKEKALRGRDATEDNSIAAGKKRARLEARANAFGQALDVMVGAEG